jgi:hypothetical protein
VITLSGLQLTKVFIRIILIIMIIVRVPVRPQAGSATPQRPIRVRKTAPALHAQVRVDPVVLRSRFLGPMRPLRARNRVGSNETSRSQDRQCEGRPLRGGRVRFRIARYRFYKNLKFCRCCLM